MRRKIVILLAVAILLSGCGMYDLGGFVIPDDGKFLEVVESLDTPKKICEYMKGFEWNISISTYSPYEMYLANLENWNDTGDCDDFAAYGMYVANIHGYTTYRITMWTKFTRFYGLPLVLPHVITIYEEDKGYSYSTNSCYVWTYAKTFQEVILNYEINFDKVLFYKVYDYEMNLIKEDS